jgi:hypothetical protein
MMEVSASGKGSDLTIRHIGLVDQESATSHSGGWNSTLNKLEKLTN